MNGTMQRGSLPLDLSVYPPIPVGEAIELPPEDGWRRWDLAVKLQDPPQEPPSQWRLEPVEGLA